MILLFLYILSHIGLMLYVCNLAYQVYLQEPKHCNAEILVRLNGELTKTRENLMAVEGKIKLNIFKRKLE